MVTETAVFVQNVCSYYFDFLQVAVLVEKDVLLG